MGNDRTFLRMFGGFIVLMVILMLIGLARADTFVLYDTVRDNTAEEFLEFVDTDADEVTIELSNQGGNVFAAFAILDGIVRLQEQGVHVTTRVSGGCLSACAFIFLYGDTRIMGYESVLMLHHIRNPREGINDVSRFLQRNFNAHVAERLDFDLATFREMVEEETWLDSSRAYLIGFATHIE